MDAGTKLVIIAALLKLYGERYIHVDQEQADFDCKNNRDSMIEAFSAILDVARESET